ncbi:hypothetical protein H5410_044641 [Solanum commersonii]|uniref:Uncharacterized protein n=1 Tax=Solanum commersonii TaxID=4109 RepID=A0A9J5X957_SOLCO|nr:hypothetical protein H5410_044641 [Solanum commersonii]
MPPPSPQSFSSLPCLMNLQKETCMVEFFDPKVDIPKFRNAQIRSSKANWLLMIHGNGGMFFFNTISNDIIELSNLLDENENSCSAWTFSCPPDSSSSDCFVVGFEIGGDVPDVYIIKLEILNGRITTLGIIEQNFKPRENSAAKRPKWTFYGKHFLRSKQRSIRKAYTVEDVDNEGMLVVFLSRVDRDVEVGDTN